MHFVEILLPNIQKVLSGFRSHFSMHQNKLSVILLIMALRTYPVPSDTAEMFLKRITSPYCTPIAVKCHSQVRRGLSCARRENGVIDA